MMINEEQSDDIISSIHIATALIALKSRHHLSNNCIEDILALLNILGINIPSSYKALCSLLRKRSKTHLTPAIHTICPHCQNLSSEGEQCTVCGAKYSPISSVKIPLFYTYDIFQQLKAILATSKDLVLHNSSALKKTTMRDITDGKAYKTLIQNESESFITLTMNVDGVQPNKGSDQSIWPVLLVVNEVNLKKRYSLENVIIAGIWPGPSKPSRTQMSLLFKYIVLELQELEKGHVFELYSSDQDYDSKTIKVFLIAACCDKPAQCLIQCLADPTAFFGCGHCEIEGELNIPYNSRKTFFAVATCEQKIEFVLESEMDQKWI